MARTPGPAERLLLGTGHHRGLVVSFLTPWSFDFVAGETTNKGRAAAWIHNHMTLTVWGFTFFFQACLISRSPESRARRSLWDAAASSSEVKGWITWSSTVGGEGADGVRPGRLGDRSARLVE